MKTFTEALAARGLDDWDIAQAIKRQLAARKRAASAPAPFHGPTCADLAAWQKAGLTGAALTATYVSLYEATHNLRNAPPVFATTQTAAQPSAPSKAPEKQPATKRQAPRHRASVTHCRRNPLDALLGAVHDAHLLQRETRRVARQIFA